MSFYSQRKNLFFIVERPITITPRNYEFPIKGFGYSFSSNVKDMNGDTTPEFAIGAVSIDGEPVALLVRSKPTIYIKADSKAIMSSNIIDPKNSGNL